MDLPFSRIHDPAGVIGAAPPGRPLAGLLEVRRDVPLAYAEARDGTLVAFPAHAPRITDCGLLMEPESRQLALSPMNPNSWRRWDTVRTMDLGSAVHPAFRAARMMSAARHAGCEFTGDLPPGQPVSVRIWLMIGSSGRFRVAARAADGAEAFFEGARSSVLFTSAHDRAGRFSAIQVLPRQGGLTEISFVFHPGKERATRLRLTPASDDGAAHLDVLGAQVEAGEAGCSSWIPETGMMRPADEVRLSPRLLRGTGEGGRVLARGAGLALAPSGLLSAQCPAQLTRLALFPNGIAPQEEQEWHHGGPFLAGVNLAGLEFGTERPGERDRPGGYFAGQEAQIPAFRRQGFTAFRIPVLWERLQPELGGSFDRRYLAYLNAIIDEAGSMGGHAVIDCHNYMRRLVRGRPRIIGEDPAVPATEFARFWAALAVIYRNNPGVVFNLMNEPYEVDLGALAVTYNRTIGAIRQQGARNLILLSGTHYSGAHAWRSSGSADALSNIVDPADNIAFDVHQYLDADHSGRSASCVAGRGGALLEPFTSWARRIGARGFLGEFSAGPGVDCTAELSTLLSYMAANRDVWMGWTYWAAGLGWADDDPFAIAPGASGKPQLALLSRYARQE
ncbi:glycoside hydrolase family 5 protein [Teichococcus aestuarii]|uniref:glycoside hydrolase family 5 protein n=1 Tax=Teichococcus aestuarii TaxID=568898 RepID=UPI0015E810A0|nr:glycoside hydrolase family 5 protein [Pseudoroseomonas aestuarii]